MRGCISIKSIILLLATFSLCSMDMPKKTKGFSKIDDSGMDNVIVSFSRHVLSDTDHPLVIASAKNDIVGIHSSAAHIKNKSDFKNTVCHALYYAVKNDNKNIFELLCSGKKTKKLAKNCLYSNISGFIQLALFNGSWEIVPSLTLNYLQSNAISEDVLYDGSAPKQQPDIFAALSKDGSVVIRADLFEIIRENHVAIMNLFKDKEKSLQNYTELIKKLFSKKQVQQLDSLSSFLKIDDPCKTNSAGSAGKNEKCIIS